MKIDNSKTKLFEVMSKLDKTFKPKLNEDNIYRNKYLITTIDKPLIPDAVKILSNNKNALAFHDKSSFDSFANQQKYFSASQSHCFYTEDEYNEFSQNGSQYVDPDSKASTIVFETGHEPVQVWDNKNNIGFIVPSNKTDNAPNIKEEVDYSAGEYFEDKLEEIFQEMIQKDYGYNDILEIVQKILQKQP